MKVFNEEYSLDVYSSLNFKSSWNREPSLDVVLDECRVFVQCTVCWMSNPHWIYNTHLMYSSLDIQTFAEGTVFAECSHE